jgi:hypothetical protein
MHIYKINHLCIAAKNADEAFYYFLDHTDGTISFLGLEEGETDEYRIKIKRLTEKEIDMAEVMCCFYGCSLCEDKEESVLLSYREMMNKQKKFPCIVCREE